MVEYDAGLEEFLSKHNIISMQDIYDMCPGCYTISYTNKDSLEKEIAQFMRSNKGMQGCVFSFRDHKTISPNGKYVWAWIRYTTISAKELRRKVEMKAFW